MEGPPTSIAKLEGFYNPTIWYKFSHMANATKSVNLGQGFPDWEPPKFFQDNVDKYFTNDAYYQYTRNTGDVKLVESIARNYEKSYKRKINPMTEIVVGAGAVNVLFVALTALVYPGDEVIILEPFYDCYLPQVQFNGGKVVGVPMNPPKKRSKSEYKKITNDLKDDWTVDFDLLEKAFNKNTKILLLNTPNNPTGKIFTYEELHKFIKILEKFPKVILIMDEVYEFMIGTQYKEVPRMASIPEMWERTLTIHSAGKIFSATGIRIGWAIGPNYLIRQVIAQFQFSTFCISQPMQNTIADCLDEANKPYMGYENYYMWLTNHYNNLRNHFLENLALRENIDIDLFCPEGSYFIIADISKHNPETKHFLVEDENDKSLIYHKDFKFLLNLCHDYKVVAIPCSPFYTEEHKHIGENFIRFAFCKEIKTMDKAFENLSRDVTKF